MRYASAGSVALAIVLLVGGCALRRGIPRLPMMNCEMKVTLKPAKISRAAIFAQPSEYIRPKIFGHQ